MYQADVRSEVHGRLRFSVPATGTHDAGFRATSTMSGIFAQHGRDIYAALDAASPKPLRSFASVPDFGVGSGRLARLFTGFDGRYVGVDD